MVELPPDAVLPTSHLAELLAPTLGWEKSSEVVESAAIRLGLSPGRALRVDQALAVLDELARTPGMVGIAARFARSRLEARTSAAAAPAAPRSPDAAAASASAEPLSRRSASPFHEGPKSQRLDDPVSSRSTGTSISTREIAALLSSALGTDKAQEVVAAAAARLGLSSDRLDKAHAIALLDHLAAEPGVVGLCARFGKARLILRFAA
jgi:hypothetical protein